MLDDGGKFQGADILCEVQRFRVVGRMREDGVFVMVDSSDHFRAVFSVDLGEVHTS